MIMTGLGVLISNLIFALFVMKALLAEVGFLNNAQIVVDYMLCIGGLKKMKNKRQKPKECPLCRKKIEKDEIYYTDNMGFPMCYLCFKWIHPVAYERLNKKSE